jgi:hypothetical protein
VHFYVANNTNSFHQTLTYVHFLVVVGGGGCTLGNVQHVSAWLSMSLVTVAIYVLLWIMNFGGMDSSFHTTQNKSLMESSQGLVGGKGREGQRFGPFLSIQQPKNLVFLVSSCMNILC